MKKILFKTFFLFWKTPYFQEEIGTENRCLLLLKQNNEDGFLRKAQHEYWKYIITQPS